MLYVPWSSRLHDPHRKKEDGKKQKTKEVFSEEEVLKRKCVGKEVLLFESYESRWLHELEHDKEGVLRGRVAQFDGIGSLLDEAMAKAQEDEGQEMPTDAVVAPTAQEQDERDRDEQHDSDQAQLPVEGDTGQGDIAEDIGLAVGQTDGGAIACRVDFTRDDLRPIIAH
ncbi:MAG: hypothetical protein GY820_18990, partial [Gammaproteobacteria bacterium]|nr:hypothetical protein [Gammaproteobacteria bacterium]